MFGKTVRISEVVEQQRFDFPEMAGMDILAALDGAALGFAYSEGAHRDFYRGRRVEQLPVLFKEGNIQIVQPTTEIRGFFINTDLRQHEKKRIRLYGYLQYQGVLMNNGGFNLRLNHEAYHSGTTSRFISDIIFFTVKKNIGSLTQAAHKQVIDGVLEDGSRRCEGGFEKIYNSIIVIPETQEIADFARDYILQHRNKS